MLEQTNYSLFLFESRWDRLKYLNQKQNRIESNQIATLKMKDTSNRTIMTPLVWKLVNQSAFSSLI